tara:strand:- start:2626 stop:4245 length:1620 start_codon:yes stop_codon:yes gene_type:complete
VVRFGVGFYVVSECLTVQITLDSKSSVILGTLLLAGSSVLADVSEDIGLDALSERIGAASMPTGQGVVLGQVEAEETIGSYAPDGANSHFAGKTIHLESGSGGTSGHATNVCQWMCGNVWSPAPGVSDVHAWSLQDWCLDGFLRANFPSTTPPVNTPSSIKQFNLSWMGSFGNSNNDQLVLRRADFVAHRDDVLMCHAVGNEGQSGLALMTCMFNGLSVGKVNGEHLTEDTADSVEGGGRMRPELVAPLGTSSAATGLVSGVSALLVETARTDDSLDSQADDTEVVKALLLAGASHETQQPWTNGAVLDGADRGRTARPLDDTYGAGIVNADRSHRMLTDGRTWGGLNASTAAAAGLRGWDLAFCLSGSSRWWSFSLDGSVSNATIAATWNRIVQNDFSGYSLGNVDLELWRVDPDGTLRSLVGEAGQSFFEGGNVTSQSDVDNVELLSIDGLAPGEYLLELRHDPSGVASITAGLAWYFEDPVVVEVPGDLTGDGVVGVEDLLLVISEWNCSVDCSADATGDGFVSVEDLLVVIANWP